MHTSLSLSLSLDTRVVDRGTNANILSLARYRMFDIVSIFHLFFFFFRFSLESLLDNSRRKNTVGRLRFMAVARSLDTFEIDDGGFIIRYLTNRVDERVLSRSTR